MTTIIRATDSAEFLGLIPALAGCTPRRSLVLLPFEENRSYGVMRLDLPRPDTPLAELVASLIGMICRVPHTDAVAIVVYDDVALDDARLPWTELVDALADRAEACELRVVDRICVGADAWACYGEDGLHPLSEIPAAPTVPGIGDVSIDQHHGAELPPVDAQERRNVSAALDALRGVLDERLAGQELSEGRHNPQALDAAARLDDVPAFFERMLEPAEARDPFDLAALAWCLNRPLFRDVALVQWARDQREGLRALGAQLAYRDRAAAIPESLGGTLLGAGPRPDPDRLRNAQELARRLAPQLDGTDRVGPLVAAAWLSWALGRSTHAAAHIEQALALSPEHSMANLLASVLHAGLLPDWAFTRRR